MIIDSHVHAGRADGLTHSWNTFEDIEVSIDRMDRCGIDRAIVLPIGTTDFDVRNRQTAAICRRYPDRLNGLAKLSQVEDDDRAEALLDEAFGELGLVGLKLHGQPSRAIMDALNRHRRPLLADVYGKVYPLRHIAEQYPDIPLIIAHMGQFCTTDNPGARMATLWLAQRYPNVYFDTSSVADHEWLERAVREGLAGKMIFGSDGPVLHSGVELARIKYLDLTDDQRAGVLCNTAARLYGIGDGGR
ncbi:MAG: amidohydrolase family protein [Planctomycetota bacterium]